MSKEVKESVVATIELPQGAEKEAVIQEEVSLVKVQVKKMVITNDMEYEQAAELGKQIKAKAKVVTDFFEPMKSTAYQAHRAVCEREKTMLKPLQEAEKTLKKKHDNLLSGTGR